MANKVDDHLEMMEAFNPSAGGNPESLQEDRLEETRVQEIYADAKDFWGAFLPLFLFEGAGESDVTSRVHAPMSGMLMSRPGAIQDAGVIYSGAPAEARGLPEEGGVGPSWSESAPFYTAGAGAPAARGGVSLAEGAAQSARERSALERAKAVHHRVEAKRAEDLPRLLRESWAEKSVMRYPAEEVYGRGYRDKSHPDWTGKRAYGTPGMVPPGELQTFYHLTTQDFPEFDLSKAGTATDAGYYGTGAYFTPRPQNVEGYTIMEHGPASLSRSDWVYREGAKYIPVNLNFENPLDVTPHLDFKPVPFRGLFDSERTVLDAYEAFVSRSGMNKGAVSDALIEINRPGYIDGVLSELESFSGGPSSKEHWDVTYGESFRTLSETKEALSDPKTRAIFEDYARLTDEIKLAVKYRPSDEGLVDYVEGTIGTRARAPYGVGHPLHGVDLKDEIARRAADLFDSGDLVRRGVISKLDQAGIAEGIEKSYQFERREYLYLDLDDISTRDWNAGLINREDVEREKITRQRRLELAPDASWDTRSAVDEPAKISSLRARVKKTQALAEVAEAGRVSRAEDSYVWKNRYKDGLRGADLPRSLPTSSLGPFLDQEVGHVYKLAYDLLSSAGKSTSRASVEAVLLGRRDAVERMIEPRGMGWNRDLSPEDFATRLDELFSSKAKRYNTVQAPAAFYAGEVARVAEVLEDQEDMWGEVLEKLKTLKREASRNAITYAGSPYRAEAISQFAKDNGFDSIRVFDMDIEGSPQIREAVSLYPGEQVKGVFDPTGERISGGITATEEERLRVREAQESIVTKNQAMAKARMEQSLLERAKAAGWDKAKRFGSKVLLPALDILDLMMLAAAPIVPFFQEYNEGDSLSGVVRFMALEGFRHPLRRNEIGDGLFMTLVGDGDLTRELYKDGILSHALSLKINAERARRATDDEDLLMAGLAVDE